jgi:activator of 2-hydroxyglutaryl-CoA dehydratase
LKKLSGGIDIGSEQHHVIIINDEEEILYDKKVAHKFSEFRKAIEEFREIEAREEMRISFAIEGKTDMDRHLTGY